jgi:hypothetical protein
MDQLIGQFSRPHYTVLQCVSSISRAPETGNETREKPMLLLARAPNLEEAIKLVIEG